MYACTTVEYSKFTNIAPVNINPQKTHWLIDFPMLSNINSNLKYEIIAIAKQQLVKKKFKEVHTITDFNHFNSFSKIVQSDLDVLDLYKEQYNCDYVIVPHITKIDNELNPCKIFPDKRHPDKVNIQILVYDVSSKEVICDTEYVCEYEVGQGFDPNYSKGFDKFVLQCMKPIFKEFGKKYNWEYVNSTLLNY